MKLYGMGYIYLYIYLYIYTCGYIWYIHVQRGTNMYIHVYVLCMVCVKV